jgi:hypothetical protein
MILTEFIFDPQATRNCANKVKLFLALRMVLYQHEAKYAGREN